MNKEIEYVVFDGRQSVLDSIIKDGTSLAALSLMVYISHGSNWWTLVTGSAFIAWVAIRLGSITKERTKRFASKEELQKWVDSL